MTLAGPSDDAPAESLIESGFALEIADAPLLHVPLTLADLAHVLDLRSRGIVPADATARLVGLLLEVYDVPAERFPYDASVGDPYNCRERYFIERIGDDAGWLHAGRPRREAARVALRILLRRQLADLIMRAATFSAEVATVAGDHAETYMPDQTYLQQAQPSTFGHYLLTFAYSGLRDAERLSGCLDWINQSPGGAGCVNGSRLVHDRSTVARLLGFDGFIVHTRDAMWQVDGFIDLLAAAVSLVIHESKLAEDLEIWDSQEFGFVDLAGPYTRASVLMPQKRNPYALAIVRGAAGIMIGRLSGFLALIKTPSARSDNLIYSQGEVPRALDLAGRVTRLMGEVVATLRVDAGRMLEQLETGFSQATDLAEFVMLECGLDYRTAYLVVGRTVRNASQRGLRGMDITGAMLDQAAEELLGHGLKLSGRGLSEVLDPRAIVQTRDAAGGAAPEVVRQMSLSCRAQAEDSRRIAMARAEAFRESEAELLRQAKEVADG
jgi:argininosuccinate lyase